MDKYAAYAPAVRWTQNGPVRFTPRPDPRLSWIARLIAWIAAGSPTAKETA